MRRLLTFLALLTVSAACSDTPTDTKLRPGDVRGPLLQLSLEDYIQQQIDALLPKGFEASVDARWSTVLEKEAAGDIEGAKKHLFTLTDWITKKTGEITPPDGETQAHAAARLNFAMFERIFGGPGAQVPEVAPNSDIVFAIVPAGEAATITTPAVQAGLSFDAGATGETRAFVITQDPKRYEGQCEGPLPTDDDPAFPKQRTRLCQYPLFYIFNSYPDLPLN